MQKIMFNDKYRLTKAVLDGIKTQTRRIIPLTDVDREYPEFDWDLGESIIMEWHTRYKVGEEVAVAQRYSECRRAVCLVDSAGWDNKMFVKSYLMPYRIKITNIRVERLQDISDEDCMKEGVIHYDDVFGEGYMLAETYNNNYRRHCFTTPRKAFAHLIDSTCGKGTWESNPYVFVYEFELIK